MAQSPLKSKWSVDYHGNPLLLVSKKRGHISQAELRNYLLYDQQEYGHYIIIINASEGACEIGWPEEEQSGDVIELYRYDHEEHCPVCNYLSVPDYCVKCGHPIDLQKDYSEPIKAFQGDGKEPRPLFQLACYYATEGGGGVCACGVSDSIGGIMDLMHTHIQEILYVNDRDPFFKLPAPSEDDLPGTIKYEWDDARVQVEYVIAHANVLIQEKKPRA